MKIDVPDFVDSCSGYLFYCNGPGHNEPVLLPKDQFIHVRRPIGGGSFKRGQGNKGSYLYRQKICRHCKYVKRESKWQYRQHGLVPLSRIRPYLEELEARCGSARKAALRAGVDHTLYLAWQGRSKHPHIKDSMQKESATKVFIALREARRETENTNIIYAPTGKLVGINGGRYCSGCGARFENHTKGCKSCLYRKRRRAS